MPGDKIARIAALQAQGRNLLMVGDGLNDAPLSGRRRRFAVGSDGAHLAHAAASAVYLGICPDTFLTSS